MVVLSSGPQIEPGPLSCITQYDMHIPMRLLPSKHYSLYAKSSEQHEDVNVYASWLSGREVRGSCIIICYGPGLEEPLIATLSELYPQLVENLKIIL